MCIEGGLLLDLQGEESITSVVQLPENIFVGMFSGPHNREGVFLFHLVRGKIVLKEHLGTSNYNNTDRFVT